MARVRQEQHSEAVERSQVNVTKVSIPFGQIFWPVFWALVAQVPFWFLVALAMVALLAAD